MRVLGVVTLASVLLVAPAIAQNPEDEGGPGVPFADAITPIACPGTALIELDWDLMPAGPTTVADIQAAFPGTALADITLTAPTSGAGVYDTSLGGAALGGDPSGDLSLHIIAEGASYGAIDQLNIDFSALVMEAGVRIGDWAGPANVEIFDGGSSVGSATFDTMGGTTLFCFSSDVPFDTMRVTLNPQFPAGNWVASALWVEPGGPVPTMGSWGYALLIVFLVLGSLYAVRKRVHRA